MKKTLVLFFSLLALAACQNSDPTPPIEDCQLKLLSSNNMTFEAEGGKATELSQDVRDSIKSLWENGLPWEDVFAPIEDVVLRTRYIDLFNKLEELKMGADA